MGPRYGRNVIECWFFCTPRRMPIKPENKTTKATEIRSYDYAHAEPQPSTESLDLGMYARIREEGQRRADGAGRLPA